MRLRSFVAATLAVLAVAGCAVPMLQRELPQATGSALVERWPLTVGLVLAPGVEATQDKYVPDIGASIGPTLAWALEQRFQRVVVGSAPERAGTFTVVGAAASGGYLEFEIALEDAQGREIDRWSIKGNGASVMVQGMVPIGLHYALALRDASAILITTLPDRPHIRSWLAAHGIDMPADGPALRATLTAAADHTRVALLPMPSSAENRILVASRAQTCLGARLEPAIPTVDEETMRHSLYPWLEPSVAPASAPALLDFLGEPALRAVLEHMGIRYVVLFSGDTKTDFDKGGILCGGGFGAGGCFGFSWGTRASSFAAIVLDTRTGTTAGDPQAERTASVYMPAFILPIPLIGATEGEACDELAAHVRQLVRAPSPK
jgi:hypothetical protein